MNTTRSTRSNPSSSQPRGLPASRGRGSHARGRKIVTTNRPAPAAPIESENTIENSIPHDTNQVNPDLDDRPMPTAVKRTCRRPVTRATEGRQTELPDDFPTYENYQELRKAWPTDRVKEVMFSRRHLNVSRANPEALAELQLAQKKFEWSLRCIAMLANITYTTARKELWVIFFRMSQHQFLYFNRP